MISLWQKILMFIILQSVAETDSEGIETSIIIDIDCAA